MPDIFIGWPRLLWHPGTCSFTRLGLSPFGHAAMGDKMIRTPEDDEFAEADEILSELRKKADTGEGDLPWGDCLSRSWEDGVLRVTRSYAAGSDGSSPDLIIQEFPYSAHPCSGVGGTGGMVWPGAILLASQLRRRSELLSEASVVLELGAGCGLPGLAAASLLRNAGESRVILTDGPEPLCLRVPALKSTRCVMGWHRLWSIRSVPSFVRGLATSTNRIASPESKLKFHVEKGSAALGQSQGPLALYESLVASGKLREDEEQRRVLQILNAIFFGAAKRTARGLYLYGSVGCGKTMSMDIFHSSLQDSAALRVQRKHFHEFLYDVQRLLHQIKKEDEQGVQTGLGVQRAGERIAASVDVRGVTVIATSNRAPEDLYSDGLNRQVYLPPFLDLLREHCKVHHMQSGTDYRAVQYESSPDAGVFCWPQEAAFVDQWFQRLTGTMGRQGQVEVAYGRVLPVPSISPCGGLARFSFEDLCVSHLAADDYNAICGRFHTILLDAVPRLTVDQHNEARRFTLLVDCCYEHHIRLIASLEAPPAEILGGLMELQNISMNSLGQGEAGCGDSDSAASSSGVLSAISRIKKSMDSRAPDPGAADPATLFSREGLGTQSVLESEIQRARSHGGDMSVWRQEGSDSNGGPRSLPQVSKGWDDRRRISQFTWESTDPTSEQQAIKGVFVAAVASLKESGFAVHRAISRLQEMQTDDEVADNDMLSVLIGHEDDGVVYTTNDGGFPGSPLREARTGKLRVLLRDTEHWTPSSATADDGGGLSALPTSRSPESMSPDRDHHESEMSGSKSSRPRASLELHRTSVRQDHECQNQAVLANLEENARANADRVSPVELQVCKLIWEELLDGSAPPPAEEIDLMLGSDVIWGDRGPLVAHVARLLVRPAGWLVISAQKGREGLDAFQQLLCSTTAPLGPAFSIEVLEEQMNGEAFLVFFCRRDAH
ncbi:Lactation elevated protein 1 [Symbiodinium microadriaticum]|uniref:Lactation elevated protein 1 n=1 Tax=Symbiodinium microadriaticum TaxID=2951 RepID=A0A1Q9EEF0_SYMMI|nr:Lactation elevated protein 1 [Symbiodinium microadriaticum]